MFRNRPIPKNETPAQRQAREDREACFAYRARRFHTSARQRLDNYKADNYIPPQADPVVAK